MSAQPIVTEDDDVAPITIDLVFWLGVILFVLAMGTGTLLGSLLLHTWDAEIRHALLSAWDMLQRLYWAWASLNG